MIRTLLFIGSTIWLMACGNFREEVTPEGLADESSKLIVACFVSPQDTMLTAKVARSRPAFDADPTRGVEIGDAIVTLSDGQQTVQLPYDGRVGYYQADARLLPIVAGRSYTIVVKATNGQQVTASARVPSAVFIQSITHTLTPTANGTQLETTASWKDPADTADFYQLRGQVKGESGSQWVTFTANEQGFFADTGKDGTLLASTTGYIDNILGNQLTMSLWHLDEAYFRYHQAVMLQQATDGNPFAEPTPIPSNIEGGIGCFGAYNQTTIVRSLR